MPAKKTCGCLIASGVINSEIVRKKTSLQLKETNKKLAMARDKKTIERLKSQRKYLQEQLKTVKSAKYSLKRRFAEYVKRSGYVPPKLKR